MSIYNMGESNYMVLRTSPHEYSKSGISYNPVMKCGESVSSVKIWSMYPFEFGSKVFDFVMELFHSPGVESRILNNFLKEKGIERVYWRMQVLTLISETEVVKIHSSKQEINERHGLKDRFYISPCTHHSELAVKIYYRDMRDDYEPNDKPVYVLGVVRNSHDSAAALLKDGVILGAIEEERLNLNKHTLAYFPVESTRYLLEAHGLTFEDIDHVAVTYDYNFYRPTSGSRDPNYHFRRQYNLPLPSTGVDQRYNTDLLQTFLEEMAVHHGTGHIPSVTFVKHHKCHAEAAYRASGFTEPTLVVTIDGQGEDESTTVWLGKDGELQKIASTVPFIHSLGHFYHIFTVYLGYKRHDEGKVMGYAPYGRPRNVEEERAVTQLRQFMCELIRFNPQTGQIEMNQKYFSLSTARALPGVGLSQEGLRRLGEMVPPMLEGKTGRDLKPEDRKKAHLAYAMQERAENVIHDMIEFYLTRHPKTRGVEFVAMAGGLSLNIASNGRLIEKGIVATNKFYVPAYPADDGTSVGAALSVAHEEYRLNTHHAVRRVSFGKTYSDDQIKEVLDRFGLVELIDYEHVEGDQALIEKVADAIVNDATVAWFQGGSELGPRALGNRCILNRLTDPEGNLKVNRIKNREFWRPSALSIQEERAAVFLEGVSTSPFMTIGFPVTEAKKDVIKAGVHPADATTRAQTVDHETDPLYWALLGEMGERTGVPGVLNTSFNRGGPIVETPEMALNTYFYGNGLDLLAIGHFIVKRKDRFWPSVLSSRDEPQLKEFFSAKRFEDVPGSASWDGFWQDAIRLVAERNAVMQHFFIVTIEDVGESREVLRVPLLKEMFQTGTCENIIVDLAGRIQQEIGHKGPVAVALETTDSDLEQVIVRLFQKYALAEIRKNWNFIRLGYARQNVLGLPISPKRMWLTQVTETLPVESEKKKSEIRKHPTLLAVTGPAVNSRAFVVNSMKETYYVIDIVRWEMDEVKADSLGDPFLGMRFNEYVCAMERLRQGKTAMIPLRHTLPTESPKRGFALLDKDATKAYSSALTKRSSRIWIRDDDQLFEQVFPEPTDIYIVNTSATAGFPILRRQFQEIYFVASQRQLKAFSEGKAAGIPGMRGIEFATIIVEADPIVENGGMRLSQESARDFINAFLSNRYLAVDYLHPTAVYLFAREAERFGVVKVEWILRSVLGKTSQSALSNKEIVGFFRDGMVSPQTMLYQCVLRPGHIHHSVRLKKDLPIRAVNQPFTPVIAAAIVERMVRDLNADYNLQGVIEKYQREGRKLSVIGKGHGGLILGMMVAESLDLPFLPLTKNPFDFYLNDIGNKVWVSVEEPHLPKNSPIFLSHMLIEHGMGVILVDDEATSGRVHNNIITELAKHDVSMELVAVLLKASDRARTAMSRLGVPFYYMSEEETKDDEPLTRPEVIRFGDFKIQEEAAVFSEEDALCAFPFTKYQFRDKAGLFVDHPLRGMTMELKTPQLRGARKLIKEKLDRLVDMKKARQEASRRERSIFVVGTTPSGLHTALTVSNVTNLPLLSASTRPEPVGLDDVVNYIGLDGYTYSIYGLVPGDSVVLVSGELSDGEEQWRIVKALRDYGIKIVAHVAAMENVRYQGHEIMRTLNIPSASLFTQNYQENIETLNTTKKARASLVYALDNLSREIKRLHPDAKINAVKALPSSFTRGVMMYGSDLDEVYIFVECVPQSELDVLYPQFFEWIEREDINYVDDHSHAPILISEENRRNQARKYPVNELSLIDLMEDEFIKPMDQIAAESNREISMFSYEKTVARIKLLLLLGELNETFVRKSLEGEDPTIEFRDLTVFLETYKSHPLSERTRTFVLRLDQSYLTGGYIYLTDKFEEFWEALEELSALGLVRIFGTKILPVWRMHSGRVSRRFWDRQIQVVTKEDSDAELSVKMAAVFARLKPAEPEAIRTSLRSEDSFEIEMGLRAWMDQDLTLTDEEMEIILSILEQGSTLNAIAASDLILKYPDAFLEKIQQRISARIPINAETGFTYQERLGISWLGTVLMRVGQTSEKRAEQAANFIYENAFKGQEQDPRSLPHFAMVNIIENLPDVLSLISDPSLKDALEQSLALMTECPSELIVDKARVVLDAVKTRSELRNISRDLTDVEKKFLTPAYQSVREWWSSGWREEHSNAVVVYAIRHQESLMNLRNTTQMRDYFSPVTLRGRLQSKAMAEFLSDVPFDIFTSSDSERAYQMLETLWRRQGREDAMPFDPRLAEINMYPIGGVPHDVARLIFDPKRLFKRYPELFRNINLVSLPELVEDLRQFYQDLLNSRGIEGKTVAIATHSQSILVQLMVMGRIPVEKFVSVEKHVYTEKGRCPHAGINVVAYLPEDDHWKVLVLKDGTYLPSELQQRSSGYESFISNVYGILFGLIRRAQYLASGKMLHPIHRDYYPTGNTWFWSLWTPGRAAVTQWHETFLAKHPGIEAERLREIPSEVFREELRSPEDITVRRQERIPQRFPWMPLLVPQPIRQFDNIAINLTNWCPVGCTFCFMKAVADRRKTKSLSTEAVMRILRYAKEKQVPRLDLSGGEALDEMDTVLRIINEADVDIVSITTSGYFAATISRTEAVMDSLAAAILQRKRAGKKTFRLDFYVSVDEFHSRIPLDNIKRIIQTLEKYRYTKYTDIALELRGLLMPNDPIPGLVASLGGWIIEAPQKLSFPIQEIVLPSGYQFTAKYGEIKILADMLGTEVAETEFDPVYTRILENDVVTIGKGKQGGISLDVSYDGIITLQEYLAEDFALGNANDENDFNEVDRRLVLDPLVVALREIGLNKVLDIAACMRPHIRERSVEANNMFLAVSDIIADDELREFVYRELLTLIEKPQVSKSFDEPWMPLSIPRPVDHYESMYVELTNLCPVQCEHCFMDPARDRRRAKRLTPEAVGKILAFIKDKSVSILNLTGGEPFTEMETVMRFIREADVDLLSIATSGYDATSEARAEEILDQLAEALKDRESTVKKPIRLDFRVSADWFHWSTAAKVLPHIIRVFKKYGDSKYEGIQLQLLGLLSGEDPVPAFVKEIGGEILEDPSGGRFPTKQIVLSSGLSIPIKYGEMKITDDTLGTPVAESDFTKIFGERLQEEVIYIGGGKTGGVSVSVSHDGYVSQQEFLSRKFPLTSVYHAFFLEELERRLTLDPLVVALREFGLKAVLDIAARKRPRIAERAINANNQFMAVLDIVEDQELKAYVYKELIQVFERKSERSVERFIQS
ncbi:Carbamoyltransferase [Candidatus Magnetomorum sp. HK-1]|nr:Carbamoyltransferase [Candidatus Magnetomorum sp. HK-1]